MAGRPDAWAPELWAAFSEYLEKAETSIQDFLSMDAGDAAATAEDFLAKDKAAEGFPPPKKGMLKTNLRLWAAAPPPHSGTAKDKVHNEHHVRQLDGIYTSTSAYANGGEHFRAMYYYQEDYTQDPEPEKDSARAGLPPLFKALDAAKKRLLETAWKDRKQAKPSVGDHVTVTTGFVSDDGLGDDVVLRAGLQGIVLEVSENGNAHIKFDELPDTQWLFPSEFPHITFRLASGHHTAIALFSTDELTDPVDAVKLRKKALEKLQGGSYGEDPFRFKNEEEALKEKAKPHSGAKGLPFSAEGVAAFASLLGGLWAERGELRSRDSQTYG